MKTQYGLILFIKFPEIWSKHFWSTPFIKSLSLFKHGFHLTSMLGLGFSLTRLYVQTPNAPQIAPEFLQSIPEVIS